MATKKILTDLEIGGAVTIDSSTDTILKLNSTDNNAMYINYSRSDDRHAYVGFGGSSDNFTIMSEEATGQVLLGTAGVTRMTIDSDGNVGIGAGATTPDVMLDVSTSIYANAFVPIQDLKYSTFDVMKLGYTGLTGSIRKGTIDTASYGFSINTGDGSERFAIDTSGNVDIGGKVSITQDGGVLLELLDDDLGIDTIYEVDGVMGNDGSFLTSFDNGVTQSHMIGVQLDGADKILWLAYQKIDLVKSNASIKTFKTFIADPIDISTITYPEDGEIAIDSADLNELKWYNGTDWKTVNPGFALASTETGTVNSTKDIVRSGLTSFGGDDPSRQVEVIGDFWNKESISGVGTAVIETSSNLFSDFGYTGDLIGGYAACYRKDSSTAFSNIVLGDTSISTVSDTTASVGVNIGTSPLAPTSLARVFAWESISSGNLIVDLHTKNGSEENKFRVRSGVMEFNKGLRGFLYGDGNYQEGDTYVDADLGTTTLGAATQLAAFDVDGNLIEIDATKLGNVGYTVSTIPTGSVGDRAYVTDASGTVRFGETLTGGGAVTIPVFHNGTNWIYG
jgi:hypothetical protein